MWFCIGLLYWLILLMVVLFVDFRIVFDLVCCFFWIRVFSFFFMFLGYIFIGIKFILCIDDDIFMGCFFCGGMIFGRVEVIVDGMLLIVVFGCCRVGVVIGCFVVFFFFCFCLWVVVDMGWMDWLIGIVVFIFLGWRFIFILVLVGFILYGVVYCFLLCLGSCFDFFVFDDLRDLKDLVLENLDIVFIFLVLCLNLFIFSLFMGILVLGLILLGEDDGCLNLFSLDIMVCMFFFVFVVVLEFCIEFCIVFIVR